MEKMKAYLDEIGSPMGQIDFATDEAGSFLGLRFRVGRRSLSLEKELERAGFDLVARNAWTFMYATGAREQLVEYFAGERRLFDLPVARKGSDFEEAVWEEISCIPFGETRTYGQVAEAVGGTGDAQEADGSLKGYADGLPLKARLLAFEEENQKPLFAQGIPETSPDPVG
jgi:methylated-DNA-[protein]-cysteine S-methyltransferase